VEEDISCVHYCLEFESDRCQNRLGFAEGSLSSGCY